MSYCTQVGGQHAHPKFHDKIPLKKPTIQKRIIMSAALDKSLDDIISSTRKAKKVANKKKAVGKGVGKVQKKQVVSFKKDKPATKKAAAPAVDLSDATKVVAQGLPRDLKQQNVKVC